MDTKSEKPRKTSSSKRRLNREHARSVYRAIKRIGMTQTEYRALSPEQRKFVREGGVPKGYAVLHDSRDARELHQGHTFVYVLVHPAFPDACKVGHTKDLSARIRTYQTACPDNMFRYLSTFAHQDWDYVYDFYEEYQGVRLKGEWFAMCAHEAARAIRKYWELL